MAWTAPRTWVDDEVVDASIFNAQVRDNLLQLDQHQHTGSSGEGGQTLGNLVKATLTDAAAPAAPGAGLTSIYTVSGTPHFRAGSGGSDTELSAEGHGHTLTEDDKNELFRGGSTDQIFAFFVSIAASTNDTASINLTQAKVGRICGFATIHLAGSTGGGSPDTFTLDVDGVEVESISLSNSADRETLKGSRSVAIATINVICEFVHLSNARFIMMDVAAVGVVI